MTLEALLARLHAEHVPEYLYALSGTLGGGDVFGIEQTSSGWCVYFSDRGSKTNPRYFASEEEAVAHFAHCIEETIKEYEQRDVSLLS